MNGFQRRRELKKKNILQAALRLFSTRGIKEVTITEIARAAHVSQVSIYNFFGSKENLLRQSIFAFMDTGLEESERVLASEIPFREKMEKLLFITGEARRQSGSELFLSAVQNDPTIRKMMGEYYRSRTEPFIIRMVEQGKEAGAINRELSTEAVRLFINALQGMLAQSGLSPEVRHDLDTLFFYGIGGSSQDGK